MLRQGGYSESSPFRSFQQELPHELHHRMELEVLVALPAEAVAFVKFGRRGKISTPYEAVEG